MNSIFQFCRIFFKIFLQICRKFLTTTSSLKHGMEVGSALPTTSTGFYNERHSKSEKTFILKIQRSQRQPCDGGRERRWGTSHGSWKHHERQWQLQLRRRRQRQREDAKTLIVKLTVCYIFGILMTRPVQPSTAQNSLARCSNVQTCSKLFQMNSNVFKCVKTCSKLFKCVQMC